MSDATFEMPSGSSPGRAPSPNPPSDLSVDPSLAEWDVDEVKLINDNVESPLIVVFGVSISRRVLFAVLASLVIAIGLILWVNWTFADSVTGVNESGRSKWSVLAETPGGVKTSLGWAAAANLSWPIPILNIVIPALAQWQISKFTTSAAKGVAAAAPSPAQISFPRPPIY